MNEDRPPLPFLAVLSEDLAVGPYGPRRELSFAAPRSAAPLHPERPHDRTEPASRRAA